MKRIRLISILNLLASGAMLAGCSRSGSGASAMLPESKVPATVNQAFAKAPVEIKEEAAGAIAAFQGADASLAFAQLQKMSSEPNLTAPERAAVAKAKQVAFLKLQTAAQNGDAAAQSTMNHYLSSR
jgi:hypothetical protein